MIPIRSSLILATALYLMGCQAKPQQSSSYPQLQIGPQAQSYLQIEAVQEGTVSTNLLRAGVRLYNRSQYEHSLRHRFIWYDTSGFELKGLASRWEQRVLRPQESIMIDRVAPSPQAVSYRIQLFDLRTPSPQTSQGVDG